MNANVKKLTVPLLHIRGEEGWKRPIKELFTFGASMEHEEFWDVWSYREGWMGFKLLTR